MGSQQRFAFVFDFDGPIFDGRAAAGTALAATFDKFEADLGRPRIPFDGVPLFNPARLIDLFYAGMWDGPVTNREVLDFYRTELEACETRMSVSQEVRDMLDGLAGAFDLAVLSSRKGSELRNRIKNLGLETYFKAVCGKGDLEHGKPDPRSLEELAGRLGVPLDRLVMVGDNDWDYLCTRNSEKSAAYYHAGWSAEPAHLARSKAQVILDSPKDLWLGLKRYRDLNITNPTSPPDPLSRAVTRKDLVFYAGAGVSVPSGLGQWHDHYLPILRDLGVSFLADGWEMVDVLQLAAADADSRKPLFDQFRESFSKPASPSVYHFAMLRSAARRIWTSNYDSLFEGANLKGHFGWTVITNDRKLMDNYRTPKKLIKMNGDFETASFTEDKLHWDLTFTQEQFDIAEHERGEIWRLFEDDYRGRCLVFVGTSMRDPALRRIVTVARQKVRSTNYPHYLLMRRGAHPLEAVEQALFARNLSQQNIQVLFLEDHHAIESMVTQLSRASYRPIVGFSGNFGHRLQPGHGMADFAKVTLENGEIDAAKVADFCKTLGAGLARRGIRVTSGCAPGVGIPAVGAAFDVDPGLARFYLRKHGGTRYNRTAPAVVVKGDDPNPGYGAMRARMIPEQSLLIAVAGLPHGEDFSGTIAEIEMAMAQRIPVILIPQAGGDVAAYAEHFPARIHAGYPDAALALAIEELNRDIAKLPGEALTAFAANQFVSRIEALLAAFMGSSLDYHFHDPDVKEKAEW